MKNLKGKERGQPSRASGYRTDGSGDKSPFDPRAFLIFFFVFRCRVNDRAFFFFLFWFLRVFLENVVRGERAFTHHCSSSPRRSDTCLGTRRQSSQESHCTHASEQSGDSSACRAGEGVGIAARSSSSGVPFFFCRQEI